MRPQAVFVTLVIVLVVLAALPLGYGHEEAEGADAITRGRPWPCCDECGVCTRSRPPICACRDKSTSGCNPACKNCVMSIASDGAPVFQCMDRITNFCKRRCTGPVVAAAADDA